jgi:demethylmenaquinone methyltransferase/2-methoxy-6-polyprenyl-1,4-benzoquinol methylase
MTTPVSELTLAEMVDYYRARAPEYDEWWQRQGRYDRGPEHNARWFAEIEEVLADFDALQMSGDVLELAPGTGNWTQRLLATADMVTAVDASIEMIALNQARVQSDRVSYVLADLFAWQPERQYDAICFGFWLSPCAAGTDGCFLAHCRQGATTGRQSFLYRQLARSDHDFSGSTLTTRRFADHDA